MKDVNNTSIEVGNRISFIHYSEDNRHIPRQRLGVVIGIDQGLITLAYEDEQTPKSYKITCTNPTSIVVLTK